MLRLLRNLVVVLALVLGVAFGFYNYEPTTVDILWTETQAPLVVLLAVAFALGFVVTLIALLYKIMRLRTRLSSSRRRLNDAQAEIRNLRSMPIQDA